MSKFSKKEFKNLIREAIEETQSSNKVLLNKSTCISIFLMFIKDKSYRRKAEKSLEKINFFEKQGLEDGYIIEDIKEGLINTSQEEIEFIFQDISS